MPCMSLPGQLLAAVCSCTLAAACNPVHSAGLVETSTNLASIKPLDASATAGNASGASKAAFVVQCATRSALMPALEQVGPHEALRWSVLMQGCAGDDAVRLALSRVAVGRKTMQTATVGTRMAGNLRLTAQSFTAKLRPMPFPLRCSQVRSTIARIGRLCGAEVEQVGVHTSFLFTLRLVAENLGHGDI